MAKHQAAEPSQLGARDREILKEIIHTFITSGQPVSSRAVAKLKNFALSAATIRNIMADLEDLGFLSQPHTSAGRVPTRAGYHFYNDTLMSARSVPKRQREQIDEVLAGDPASGEKLVASASQLLSEMTRQIGIVLIPSVGETTLRSISFVPLAESRVLCVIVSASGFVDNKVLRLEAALERDELIRISNYLTDNFAGLTLREIRDRLVGLMAEERAAVDRLLANAIQLAQRALVGAERPELLVEGTAALLARPELGDIDRVRRLLDTFADKASLVRMLDQLIEGSGVRVVIGRDSDLTSDLNFSLVATGYGVGDRRIGSLGIFGPSRMDYEHVIPLVDYLGERLSRALELTLDDGPAAGDA